MPIPIVAALIGLVPAIVKKGLGIADKLLPEKLSEGDRLQIQVAMEQAMRASIVAEQDNFQRFVIEHTGAAKDMPRSIQVLRGSVRPVLTYATFVLAAWGSWYLLTHTLPEGTDMELIGEVMLLVKAMILIVLAFWFGERLLTRTGIAQVLMNRRQPKNDNP